MCEHFGKCHTFCLCHTKKQIPAFLLADIPISATNAKYSESISVNLYMKSHKHQQKYLLPSYVYITTKRDCERIVWGMTKKVKLTTHLNHDETF